MPIRLPFYLRKMRISVLGISLKHSLAASSLPGPHKDPFDRMLIAQARLEKLPMISTDPVFRNYGVRVYWYKLHDE